MIPQAMKGNNICSYCYMYMYVFCDSIDSLISQMNVDESDGSDSEENEHEFDSERYL